MEVSTLYHYCTTNTFTAIVSGRSFWLSSLTLSNDSSEGRVIWDALRDVAIRDQLPDHQLQNLVRGFTFFIERVDNIGFCLSEEPDLLSQWRAYADDGRGASVGFNVAYLEALSEQLSKNNSPGFGLRKVAYERHEHESIVKPLYDELAPNLRQGALGFATALGILALGTEEEKKAERERVEKLSDDARKRLLAASLRMYELKHPAFREEREWRLITMNLISRDAEVFYRDLNFRACGDRVVPYRITDLPDLGIPVFNRIILGPKHTTPVSAMEVFLAKYGFTDVVIERSAATYR